MKANISLYKAGNLKTPYNTVLKSDIYNNIKYSAYSIQTSLILEDYFDAIYDNFEGHNKKLYQEAKKNSLDAVTFSAIINRSTNHVESHTGLICLDIDSNTKEELEHFFQRVHNGCDAAIEACARSVSGTINGSMWCNVRVAMPKDPKKLSRKLRRLIGINKNDNRSQAIIKTHNAFYRAVTHKFTTRYGLNLPKNDNLKRVRYLSHDDSIYINNGKNAYTLQFLENFLRQEREEAKNLRKVEATTSIEAYTIFDFAKKFADSKYQYVTGNKHLYLTQFAICCNLLALPQNDCETLVKKHFTNGNDVVTNAISYPYQNYKKDFGKWKHKVNQPKFDFTLKKGEYLSKIIPQIVELYKSELCKGNTPKFCLKGNTGIGKTHSIVKYNLKDANGKEIKNLAQELKELTGKKTIFICNLNLLAEQTAQKADTEALTGTPNEEQILKALSKDVIVINYNALPQFAKYCIKHNIKVNGFVDESDTVIDGGNERYKPIVVRELLKYVSAISHSICLLSATPSDYFLDFGFKRIDIQQENRAKVKVYKNYYTSTPEAVVINHIKNNDLSNKTLVIKIQSKKRINRIYNILMERGFSSAEVVRMYSEKSIKEGRHYQRLKQGDNDGENWSFESSVKIVLCTSLINEGVNIYSDKEIEFVNIEKNQTFDYKKFDQFVGRWRTDRPKTAHSYHPISKREGTNKDPKKHIQILNLLLDDYNKEVHRLNNLEDDYLKQHKINTYSRLSDTQKFILWNDIKAKFEVNFIACCVEGERARKEYLQTEVAYKHLEEEYPYYTIIETENKNDMKLEAETNSSIQEEKKREKALQKAAKKQIVQLYTDNPTLTAFAFILSSDNKQLGKKIKREFEGINFRDKQQKLKAQQLINRNPIVFEQNINLIESFFYYLCKARSFGFDKTNEMNLLCDDSGKLRTYQKLSNLFEEIAIWYLLTIGISQEDRDDKILTKQQFRDYEKIKKIRELIIEESTFDEKTLKWKIRMHKAQDIIIQVMGKGYTRAKAKRLIRCLFKVYDCNRRKQYRIMELNSFTRLFEQLNINVSNMAKDLIQIFDYQPVRA